MWSLLFIVVVGTFLYAYLIEPNQIRISHVEIKLAHLSAVYSGLRILHLTDLHGRRFLQGKYYLSRLVNRQNPDIIIITGDIVYHPEDWQYMLKVMSRLKAGRGIYYCPGNHDYKLPIAKVFQDLKEIGVRVLTNESVTVELDGVRELQLIGIDDYGHGSPASLAAFPAEEGIPRILLSHSPDIMGEAVQHKIDLVLAGHTHGGQICLPFFGAVFTSCKNYWKEYESGYYRTGQTQIYVSRGLGCSLLPLRFFCPPEIPIYQLKENDYGRK